jgi:hypothetical protein
MTIINYVSRVINKLKALLTDEARVIIYDRHVFKVQAAGVTCFSSSTTMTSARQSLRMNLLTDGLFVG